MGATREPELLDDSAVAAWEASGGRLIDLLRQAHVPGRITGFRRGGRLSLVVTAPEHARHVLGPAADQYIKCSHRARVLLGEGLICASGEAWRSQRTTLQPYFSTDAVRRNEQRIRAAAARTVRHWEASARKGDTTDLAQDVRFFSLDAIWRLLTGRALDQDTHRDLSVIEDIVAALPTVAACPPSAGTENALAVLDACVHRAVDRARTEQAAGTGTGLLHLLVQASSNRAAAAGRGASVWSHEAARLLRDQLVTLVVAGYETTARTLEWAFVLLDEHPDVADWATRRPDHVDAVVAEVLRLFPAVWLIPRWATVSDVVDGWRVPAGAEVLVSAYHANRDPRLWPEPGRFDPVGLVRSGRTAGGPGTHLSFGLGPRNCLGRRFALREMAVLLGEALGRFTIALRERPHGAVFGANLRPDGPLPARISFRP